MGVHYGWLTWHMEDFWSHHGIGSKQGAKWSSGEIEMKQLLLNDKPLLYAQDVPIEVEHINVGKDEITGSTQGKELFRVPVKPGITYEIRQGGSQMEEEPEQIYEELRRKLPPPVLIVLEPVELPLKKEKK